MSEGLAYYYQLTEWTVEEKRDLLSAIEQARLDWYTAQLQMQAADVPDLIDYSIYAFKAAEAKYTHLLKLAKAINLHLSYDPFQGDRPYWLKGRV